MQKGSQGRFRMDLLFTGGLGAEGHVKGPHEDTGDVSHGGRTMEHLPGCVTKATAQGTEGASSLVTEEAVWLAGTGRARPSHSLTNCTL